MLEKIITPENYMVIGPVALALILLIILIVSFRSRAVVFCQYLQSMAGIRLKPSDVRRVYKERGQDGVRELFLDLIIRQDLKEGPLQIPDAEPKAGTNPPFLNSPDS